MILPKQNNRWAPGKLLLSCLFFVLVFGLLNKATKHQDAGSPSPKTNLQHLSDVRAVLSGNSHSTGYYATAPRSICYPAYRISLPKVNARICRLISTLEKTNSHLSPLIFSGSAHPLFLPDPEDGPYQG